jgi:hypothetical protein
MKLIDVTRKFQTENSCLDYIEQMRWPNGELGCVHCGEGGRISKITREAGKNKRTRIYQCLACRKHSREGTNPGGARRLASKAFRQPSRRAKGDPPPGNLRETAGMPAPCLKLKPTGPFRIIAPTLGDLHSDTPGASMSTRDRKEFKPVSQKEEGRPGLPGRPSEISVQVHGRKG